MPADTHVPVKELFIECCILGPPGEYDFKNNQRGGGGDAGCRYHYCTSVVIVIVVAVAVVVNGYPYFHNFHRRSAVCRFCLSIYFSINSHSSFTSFREYLADDMCTTTA